MQSGLPATQAIDGWEEDTADDPTSASSLLLGYFTNIHPFGIVRARKTFKDFEQRNGII